MKDFTIEAYTQYLAVIQGNGIPFFRFDEIMILPSLPNKLCLIRHDVDRKPMNALRMAQEEAKMGIKSTYYFRTKKVAFDVEVIEKIAELGHEIGYHYETLSDAKGDFSLSVELFQIELDRLRSIVPIKTISMHGRPLLPYDNRDIWRDKERHEYLITQLNILGEVYLDIDYSEIAYINDTGRNWTSNIANRRDHVLSNIDAGFDNMNALLKGLRDDRFDKLVFQIHPERWSSSAVAWYLYAAKDGLINFAKTILR